MFDFVTRAGCMEVSRLSHYLLRNLWQIVLVSIVQAWYYYGHQNDNWALKSLVLFPSVKLPFSFV